MKKLFAIAAVWIVLGAACGAEARWCSITGRAPSDRFDYPPIARAARVQGVVLSMVVYTAQGNVVRVENISGPRLLADFLTKQISQWTLRTDARGTADCQTLVIAHYRLLDGSPTMVEEAKEPELPSILQLYVNVESLRLDTNVTDQAAFHH